MAHARNVPIPRHPDRKVQAITLVAKQSETAARLNTMVDRHVLLSPGGEELLTIPASTAVEYTHNLGHEPDNFRYCVWSAAGVVNGSVRRTASTKTAITFQNDATVDVTIKVEVF